MTFIKNTYYDQLIQSTRWRKLRNAYLQAHPICECCHEQLATEVHHITNLMKFRDDPKEMEAMCFNEDNLMAVDHECHNKLHIQMKKFGHMKQDTQNLKEEKVKRFKENYF